MQYALFYVTLWIVLMQHCFEQMQLLLMFACMQQQFRTTAFWNGFQNPVSHFPSCLQYQSRCQPLSWLHSRAANAVFVSGNLLMGHLALLLISNAIFVRCCGIPQQCQIENAQQLIETYIPMLSFIWICFEPHFRWNMMLETSNEPQKSIGIHMFENR